MTRLMFVVERLIGPLLATLAVRERGDHRSLLAAGGMYRTLYELQVRQSDAGA